MSKQTSSMSAGRCAARHDARLYLPENAHREMLAENVHFVYVPVKKAFHEIFDEAVTEYNEKQTRKDRKKNDYYKEIVDGQYKENDQGKKEKIKNAPHPEYEYVFQYGNKDSNPASVLNEAGKRELGPYAIQSREALTKFFEEFRKSNPNLHITGASIHMDEATPHLHIRFVPVATGYKNGLKKRCSLTKALENQGFERGSSRGDDLALNRWRIKQEELLDEIGEMYGFEIIEGYSKGRKHIENHEWCAGIGDEITRLEKEAAQVAEECSARIREAQASMSTTLQNKKEYDEEISALRGPKSPIRAFYEAVQGFVNSLMHFESKQEIKEAAINMLKPFPPLYKSLSNTAGFENVNNLPKNERKTPELISEVDELINGAVKKANAQQGEPAARSKDDYVK